MVSGTSEVSEVPINTVLEPSDSSFDPGESTVLECSVVHLEVKSGGGPVSVEVYVMIMGSAITITPDESVG